MTSAAWTSAPAFAVARVPEAERRSRWNAAALWGATGLAAFALHVAGALWLLRAPPVTPADGAPPAAIMIELAPEPEAAATEIDEVSPDLASSEASAPAAPTEAVAAETAPEALAVEEASEAAPQAEFASPEPELEAAEAQSEEIVSEQAEVLLPRTRPKPSPDRATETSRPSPKREERRDPVRPTAAARTAAKAQAQVRQAERTAASQNSSGASAASLATWQARLMAHLERRKRYPSGSQARGERGVAYVRFTIDGAGAVRAASLARSSGFPELDSEVVALVRRASPVPAPPPGAQRTITAPVRFSPR
ncbi:protein TonB [Methylopila capsulata]|uniref:Protein TonB n=1 Tax=Methylopila capsulata TaxID=61654 RepID=A0A9W6MQR5_9HYPH|nr:energy transducer TonB [Methylopila capsulata]MBM7851194.1 protein TonB [Methylopila capsulata]GLK54251.1 hypothetical protein GCM10008170_02700 [Methylopila capsulata]